MKDDKYIYPTKKHMVFTASCNYFGSIERGLYKEWAIVYNEEGGQLIGDTFATSFTDAVNYLHEWIQENEWCVKDYPKCIFTIESINGKLDKHEEILRRKVYSISAAKAKRLLF